MQVSEPLTAAGLRDQTWLDVVGARSSPSFKFPCQGDPAGCCHSCPRRDVFARARLEVVDAGEFLRFTRGARRSGCTPAVPVCRSAKTPASASPTGYLPTKRC
jgi:hypothetical protein